VGLSLAGVMTLWTTSGVGVRAAAALPLRPDFRKCLVIYAFLMHAVLGLIHVKLQT